MKVKRLGGTKPLAEKVPAWLTQLLDNHKERPGPLIGLAPEEPTAIPYEPKNLEKDDTDLSAVLDQLAQQGPEQPSEDRLASSVEWGAYAETAGQEPPAPSIDDMLADMEYSPQDASGQVQYEQPPPVDQEAPDWGMPDWLTEGLAAPTDRDLESSTEPPPQPAPGAPAADAPDWITEVAPPDEETLHTLDPVEPHPTGQIPEWLTETSADFAPTMPSEEAEPPLPPITDHDVPNWLADAIEPPATQELDLPSELSPPPTHEESETTDWLRDALEKPPEAGEEPARLTEPEPAIPTEAAPWLEPDVMEVEEAELEAEVPDWIIDIVPPATEVPEVEPLDEPLAADTDADVADWTVPDWIAAAQMTEDEEAELKAMLPPGSRDIPDWMVEEQAPAIHDIEPPAEATEPADIDTGPPDPDDWLAPLDTPPSPVTTAPTKAPLPPGTDWLSEVDLPPIGETEKAAPETVVPPGTDWLRDVDLPPVGESEESATETPGPPGTDWLHEVDQPAFEDTQEALADASDLPDPDWLAATADTDSIAPPEGIETGVDPGSIADLDILFPSADEEEIEEEPQPKPVRKLKRLKRLSPKPEHPPQPDWVAGLVPPGASDQQAEETPDPPDWAADLVPSSVDSTMEATAPAAPNWVQELVPSDADRKPETSAEESPPEPLKKLTADPKGPEVLPYYPSDLEEPIQTEEPVAFEAASIEPTQPLETDQPDILADQEHDDVDWIAQFSRALPDTHEITEETTQQPVEPPAEAEELIDQRLDWLTGTGEPETSAEPTDVAEPTAIEEDSDIPEWLAESAEETVTDEPPVPPTEEELDLPGWLGEISGTVEEFEEEESPAWLTEPSETPDIEETAEEEQDTPAWVAASLAAGGGLAISSVEDETQVEDEQDELPQAPLTEETIAVPSVAAEEEEATDWLSELRVDAPDEDDMEAPEWLAEASAEEAPTPLPEDEPETPERLSEASEFPVADETMVPPVIEEVTMDTDWLPPSSDMEPETPDWLLESSETPGDEEPPTPSDAGGKELETPPWLSELTSVPVEEEEAETPDWLTEIPAAPDDEETHEEPSEETEVPEWVAEIPTAPGTGELTATPVTEEETELPPWLTAQSVPPAPTPETESTEPVAHEIEESDLPDWLSDLQAAPESQEEIETPEWPVETSEVPSPEEVVPEPESLEEPPAWVAKATMADEVEAAPVAETTADAELPDWLLEEEEPETPDWLVEATEQPPIDTEDEISEWLAEEETSEVEEDEEEQDGAGLAAAAGLAAMAAAGGVFIRSVSEEEPTTDEQVELSEPEEETPEPSISSKEEAEIPSWLSDLQEESTEEETQDWLAETPQAPAVEETTPTPETDEASEMPDWLAGLRAIPAEENEAEIPVWLGETADAPTGQETAPQPDITEEETPEWFVPPEAVPIDEETLAAKEDTTDIELPPWLAELPPESIETESAETPEWLTEIVDDPTDEAVETPAAEEEEEEEEEDGVGLAAAAGLAASAAAGGVLIKSAVEEEPETPDWLTRLSEPLDAEETPDLTAEQAESPDSVAKEETPVPPVDKDIETTEVESETPDWLAELGADSTSEEDLIIPDWLLGSAAAAAATVAADDTIVSPVQKGTEAIEEIAEELKSTEEAEPGLPAPPSDSFESSATPDDTSTTIVVDRQDIGLAETETEAATQVEEETDQPPASPDSEVQAEISQKDISDQAEADVSASRPAEKKSPHGGVKSSVPKADDEDLKVAEATGVLVGLSSLLPAQEIIAGTSVAALGPAAVEGHKDAVLEAAREFQAVATRTPRPAALPVPLTRRDHFVRGGARAALYLLFIILIAIPLIPGFQKITGSGQTLAWTEPTGSLGEVLDKQRRELISTELGVVDFQQPGAVALVSFDYTPATQGEMQPLAEAVIGRLKGQGMRLIFLSPEPEGATLAQQTMNKILEERGEEYGVNMLNLGYVPGQVAAIRAIAGGQPFSNLTDYNTGVPFGATEQPNWSDVENIRQVEMVVTLADNPTTGRWWVEQMSTAIEPDNGERALLAATSAVAGPYLQPYRASEQLNGLISGINGAAAIEASRKNFGPARQMLDSQSIAHLLIIILIAAGTMVGWMPPSENSST